MGSCDNGINPVTYNTTMYNVKKTESCMRVSAKF